MLQITNYNPKYNSISTRHNAAFGRSTDVLGFTDDDMSNDERAEKIRELSERISNSDKGPSAIRTFLVITGFTAAAVLTATTLSGRFFRFLENVGAFNQLSPAVSKGIEKMNAKLKAAKPDKTIKGHLQKGLATVFDGLEKNSVYGIEEKLAKISQEISKKKAALSRKVVRKNPELKGNKKAIEKAVDKMISENEELTKFFKTKNRQRYDLKGDNISKKVTQAVFGTASGIGTLKEASRDEDNNGIPDCVEYANAKKDATQKVTAAILNCAIDNM